MPQHVAHSDQRHIADLMLKGLSLYCSLLTTLRTTCAILGWRPQITARYNVQEDEHSIRVRWNAQMNPQNPSPLYVDGVSIYKVGRCARRFTVAVNQWHLRPFFHLRLEGGGPSFFEPTS